MTQVGSRHIDLHLRALRTLPVIPVEGGVSFYAHGITREGKKEKEYVEECVAHNVIPDYRVTWRFNQAEGLFLPANGHEWAHEYFFKWTYGSIRSERPPTSEASPVLKQLSAQMFRRGGKPNVIRVLLNDRSSKTLALFQQHELDELVKDSYEPRSGRLVLSTEERGCCETAGTVEDGVLYLKTEGDLRTISYDGSERSRKEIGDWLVKL
jgi:hypothetical protein